jgi:uncharacterized cupredoxin-like copper-binding protein
MRHYRNLLSAITLILLSSPSLAATTVKVIEGGEEGGPMTLSLDQPSIKAGDVVFSVHNDAMTEEHEMVLVRLKSPTQDIPIVQSKHRIDEKKLNSLGEVSDLKPGADGTLEVKLEPGTYLLFCNIKGHYEAGMHARLTVKQ